MAILVQKYGGSSVADEGKIAHVADRVLDAKQKGHDLVVVVSAMGKTTDELLTLAHRLNPDPPRRELDMLVSVGERITMSLLSMAIQHRGVDAISFTGSQCGIITNDRHSDARIIEVRPFRIQDELARNRVVIVAGFQGMSYRREITTLGRGGSDTTAVALAAALDAEACEIYGDVDGVYSGDPNLLKTAQRIDVLDYSEMQELSENGARVLNATAVEFAKARGIALFVKRTDGQGGQTMIRRHTPPSPGQVVGIAHEKQLLLIQSKHKMEELVRFLDEHAIPGKQLTCNQIDGESLTSVLVSKEFVSQPERVRRKLDERFTDQVVMRHDLGAVSLIGAGINQSFENLRLAHQVLEAAGVSACCWHISSFRITALVPTDAVTRVVGLFHRCFLEESSRDLAP